MMDPTRLGEEGEATEFERQLLSSGRHDRLSGTLRRRIRRGLGLPASGFLAWALSAKAAVIAGTSAGVLAVGIGGGMLGARLFARPQAAPPATVSVASVPAPVLPVSKVPVVAAPQMSSQPAPIEAPRPRGTGHPGGNLHVEIALVDAARAALAGGAPDRSLFLLRRYAASHPNGALAPEATALRIEALEQSGERREAEALACQFVVAHADSPLVARVGRLCERDATSRRP